MGDRMAVTQAEVAAASASAGAGLAYLHLVRALHPVQLKARRVLPSIRIAAYLMHAVTGLASGFVIPWLRFFHPEGY